MRVVRQQRGFTIVEVLIVLAVTGAMFLLAVLAVNGRQNTTEFQQAINDVRSRIQQSIDQVVAGDYPGTNSFTCNVVTGSSGQPVPNVQPGTNTQGSNTGCVFLGSALQFGLKSGSSVQQFANYTIAGVQQDSTGDEVTSLAQAAPTAIAPSSTDTTTPDVTQIGSLLDGLNAIWMKSNGVDIAAVAFISSLGQDNITNGSVTGSQQIDLYPVSTSGYSATLPATSSDVVDAIDNNLATATANPSTGVQICFVSGGTDQSGLITIGSSGRNLSVTLQIKSNRTCS